MEFHEKLQELRKNRGLTQEELAEALYVSRTAISKWESGRGYPSIDSLKGIASFYEVTIDELLSGEKLISIAEKENKANIRNMCDLLFGIVDLCFFILVLLPLYPNTVNGYIYAVNLFDYVEKNNINILIGLIAPSLKIPFPISSKLIIPNKINKTTPKRETTQNDWIVSFFNLILG